MGKGSGGEGEAETPIQNLGDVLPTCCTAHLESQGKHYHGAAVGGGQTLPAPFSLSPRDLVYFWGHAK